MRKINALDMSILCNQLGLMISTGMSLFKAFEILEFQNSNNMFKPALKSVKEDIIKGNSIHESMKKVNNIFPQFMIEMVKVGEESGRLEDILKKLSLYYQKQYNIMSEIKNALTYPVLILITGMALMLFLITKIIPQFVEVIVTTGGEIPFLTRMVIRSCDFLTQHYITVFIIFLSCAFLLRRFRGNPKVKIFWAKVKIKIPYFKKVYINLIIFKICSSMAILMNSGVNVVKALKITGGLIENEIIVERMEGSIMCMEQGEDIYGALSKLKLNNSIFLYFVKTGEATGKMEEIFYKLEELFENDVNRRFERLTKFIEPIIMIFLSLFVGIFIMAAIMPIFSIMDTAL